VPIPEAHGGEGADALATVTINEAASVRVILAALKVSQIHESTTQIRRVGVTARKVPDGCR
jgi:hypothetical protein